MRTRADRWLVVSAGAFALTIWQASAQAGSGNNVQKLRAQAAGQFRIAGVVVNAQSDAPLAGVDVTLSVAGENVQGTQDALQTTATTDEDGHFTFKGLAADKYRVAAARRGFVTSAYEEHQGFFSGVVTGPGEDTTHLRFKLAPNAVLSGTVSDDNGDPVESAQVMLFREENSDGLGRVVRVRMDMADDTGTFEFSNLTPGNYFIAAAGSPWYTFHPQPKMTSDGDEASTEAPPRSPLDVAFARTFYADATNSDEAIPIPLRAGDHPQVNLTLHAVPAITMRLRLSGTSSGTDGDAMRSRGFEAPSLSQEDFGVNRMVNTPSVRFDMKPGLSYVEIGGLAPGDYNLRWQGRGGDDAGRVEKLSLTSDQVVDAEAASAANAVTGKFSMGSGTSLPGPLRVWLRLSGAETLTPTERVGDDGRFSIPGVMPGTYELHAFAQGHALDVVQVQMAGAASEGDVVTIGNGPATITATLAEGAAKITGFVKKDGKRLSGAMIVLVPSNAATRREWFRRDQSNTDGSFTLLRVLAGRYTLVAIDDGWSLDWARPEVMGKYLAQGVRVEVGTNGNNISLQNAVEVQPR